MAAWVLKKGFTPLQPAWAFRSGSTLAVCRRRPRLSDVASSSPRGTALDEVAGRFAEMGMALADRCEDAQTPALSLLATPAPDALTAREREAAALAARSLSSPEIARQPVVSVRTVENHLHHVYGMLGIIGRDDLGKPTRAG